MERTAKSVDYLDLQIPVPPGLLQDFAKYVEDFISNADYMVIAPKLNKNILKINSKDLIDFLGYVQINDPQEFELQRFKQEARRQLENNLNKSISADYRYHYRWCLAALNIFKIGRHRAS